MSDPATASAQTEEDMYSLQAKITQLQSSVRQMKKDGASASDIAAEVEKLTSSRAKLSEMLAVTKSNEKPFNRKGFDELILRKMYVVQSFEIHNGPAGLFDYGPPACALKANMLALWRRHFVLEENMLEMECTCLTPHSVLLTSGHVDRFTDFMVKDEKSGDCFRADKLLEDAIDAFLAKNPTLALEEQEEHRRIQRQAGAMGSEDLDTYLKRYEVKSPLGNGFTRPFAFNLMFPTTIGPEGTSVGYLRPETAQGLFVNFRRLLDYNQQRMPFAAAQIGLGFRNEIAPRNGLLRVREFTMAEIEHFVNPEDKRHPKFDSVKDDVLTLFPAENQLGSGRTVSITMGEAVAAGMVNNQTLGYFMARSHRWAVKIGVNPNKIRFRQHLRTEMSHYAADCWDLEINMSYGWIECVGHADRACYDLTQHAKATGVALLASERLPAPIQVERSIAEPNKKLLGPVFKGQQKEVIAAIESLDDDQVATLQQELAANESAKVPDTEFVIAREHVTFKVEKKMVSERKYTPSVIEPSFGIGRVLYAVLEHAFSQRPGAEQRCVMAFKPCVAPIKVGIFRLINHAPFDVVVEELRNLLQTTGNLAVRVDSSAGTVGRRYARADELGIPFGITVDFQTLIDQTVTLRDRDTMAQVRVPIANVCQLVVSLVNESIDWAWVTKRYVVVKVADDEEEDGEQAAAEKAAASEVTTAAVIGVQNTTRGSFSRPAIPIL